MKIKMKRKDAMLVKGFLSVTSTLDIEEFCDLHGIPQGRKIDKSLYRLYKALDAKFQKIRDGI
ncbi:hypothetical protein KAR91_00090 [Candidatus Pacearchaeota archaeon]|nr:hypothetical protein [Candidatus Pacearchaeota archaeon]